MGARAVITLVAAALVVVLAAIPVITSMDNFTEPADNTSNTRMSLYNGETLQISFDGTVMTVNGETRSPFYIYSSTFELFFTGTGDAQVKVWEDDQRFNLAAGDTLTVSNYRVTGTGTAAIVDTHLIKGEALFINDKGALGVFFNGTPYYAGRSSTLYIINYDTPGLFIKGHVGSDFSVLLSKSWVDSAYQDVDITNIELQTTDVEGAPNTVVVSGFTLTAGDSELNNPFMVAPIEYQAPSDGGTTKTLVDVIPLFIVISLLLAAVGLFLVRSW